VIILTVENYNHDEVDMRLLLIKHAGDIIHMEQENVKFFFLPQQTKIYKIDKNKFPHGMFFQAIEK